MVFFRSAGFSFRSFGALAAVAVPVLLGGGSDPWAGAFAGLAVGGLWFFRPPGKALDRFWLVVLLLLAALPLLALLPLGVVDSDLWRDKVREFFPSLPLLTPQPALLLATLPVYWGGLALAAWLLRADWNAGEKTWLGGGLGILWIIVLVLALLRWRAGWDLPRWDPFSGTGPFVSRNPTGLFFALGLVWNLALAGICWRQRHLPAAFFWLLSCAGLALAVVLNGSRAGLGFAAFGVVLYFLLTGIACRRPVLLAVAAGLTVAALLGVGVLRLNPQSRFQELFRSDALQDSFRLKVQADTLDMIGDSPLTGVGLGNYDALFPFYRSRSANEYRVLHAESDWLHFAAESGVIALLIVAIALIRVFCAGGRNVFRDRSGFAVPAGIGMMLAVLHGFADQSLHCPGLIFVVLAMASLALPPGVPDSSGIPAWRGRLTGFGLVALSGFSLWLLRGPALRHAVAEGTDFRPASGQTLEAVDRALQRSPLSWNLHELRGHILLRAGRKDGALWEFRAARLLDPQSVLVPHREANAWFSAGQPQTGVEAAGEAVRRAPPETQVAIYEHYLMRAGNNVPVREALMNLDSSSADLEAARLAFYPPAEAMRQWEKLLARPGVRLSRLAATRLVVFSGRAAGLSGLEKLQRSGIAISDRSWESGAGKLAAEQRLREACQIIVTQLPPWKAPEGPPDLEELPRESLADPGDLSAALQLADGYLRTGHAAAARRTLERFPESSSPALDYYRGWSFYQEDDLANAWRRFTLYLQRLPDRPYDERR